MDLNPAAPHAPTADEQALVDKAKAKVQLFAEFMAQYAEFLQGLVGLGLEEAQKQMAKNEMVNDRNRAVIQEAYQALKAAYPVLPLKEKLLISQAISVAYGYVNAVSDQIHLKVNISDSVLQVLLKGK